MNALGLSMIVKMGCICSRESIDINGSKYVVKERLGEGGFSCVDLVENTSTKKRYALKRITCHSLEDQKIAMQEITYYKKLRHPSIIELIDSTFKGSADIVVQATSEAFLLLPYFKRGTLHDYLTLRSFNKNYLDIKEVLRIFGEICQAIKFLHDFTPDPIAHRDLKTANVCLTENLDPVLMDLGSCAPAKVQICGAQDAQKLQDIAAERCSMTYRAPELFHVESYCVIDQRTDIWSLGCVLYAMLYFKSPYDIVYERGDSVNLAVISGTVHFPEEYPYNEDVHDLVRFMLKVAPSERPFIDNVITKTTDLKNKLDTVV
ncbi:serine/threonine-protein kinase 16 [Anoplophora glabripennis]|uniref:serine/threonine-protein kinase 16 n=1 Tax=Anoplophora glabripennis TaxID=217634 RepID=UPI000874FE74|nr:serine/threonine-protein kinase 16 [Anoplophora glabripennis]